MNNLEQLELVAREPEDLWQEMITIVQEEAEKHVPKTMKKKKTPWLSKEAIEIAEERRLLKKTAASNEEIQKLNICFQRQARRDKETYLRGVCTQIEQDDKRGRTRDLFKKIKDITGKFKPRTSVIKDKNYREKAEEKEVKERWREYSQQLYQQEGPMRDKGKYAKQTEG